MTLRPTLLITLSILSFMQIGGCTIGSARPSASSKGYFQSDVAINSSSPVGADIEQVVRSAVQKMLENSQGIDTKPTIAVADFVTLAANYEQPSVLGRYLSQVYMNELHRVGFTTVDFQVTGAVRVTPQGNLGLSQDFLELANQVDATSLLVGTITPGVNEYVFHSRLVDLDSNAIIAAASGRLNKQNVRRAIYAHY